MGASAVLTVEVDVNVRWDTEMESGWLEQRKEGRTEGEAPKAQARAPLEFSIAFFLRAGRHPCLPPLWTTERTPRRTALTLPSPSSQTSYEVATVL